MATAGDEHGRFHLPAQAVALGLAVVTFVGIAMIKPRKEAD